MLQPLPRLFNMAYAKLNGTRAGKRISPELEMQPQKELKSVIFFIQPMHSYYNIRASGNNTARKPISVLSRLKQQISDVLTCENTSQSPSEMLKQDFSWD